MSLLLSSTGAVSVQLYVVLTMSCPVSFTVDAFYEMFEFSNQVSCLVLDITFPAWSYVIDLLFCMNFHLRIGHNVVMTTYI